MTVVSVLRELWARRLVVAVGLALAVVAGLLVAFDVGLGVPPKLSDRRYDVGVASASVLVDSPSSQVIDIGGARSRADIESLSARARLLSNIMAASPLKERIARRAGVPTAALIASAPEPGPAPAPSPVDALDSKAEASDPDAYVLTIRFNEALPIIVAEAQAPSPAAAAAIADAAVTELARYMKTAAAADRVPDARRVVVTALGPARSATVQRGPAPLYAVIAAIFVFGAWCVGILLIAGLVRNWRSAAHAERPPAGA